MGNFLDDEVIHLPGTDSISFPVHKLIQVGWQIMFMASPQALFLLDFNMILLVCVCTPVVGAHKCHRVVDRGMFSRQHLEVTRVS